jgi:hypothetical protein
MEKNYRIRQASSNDIDNIMSFIKNHWSPTHILANYKEFFEYEHRYGNVVNYIISEDVITNEIQAILGFIIYGKTNADIMTVMWKSIDKNNPFLGVELLEYLLKNVDRRIVASVGINKKTAGIYKYMGFTTGALEHYYRILDKRQYNIAKINHAFRIPAKETEYELIPLKQFEDLEKVFNFEAYKERNPKPYKEPWYIEKRYYKHPVYTYQVFGIKNQHGAIESIIVARILEVDGTKILRIVDFIGKVEDLNFISYEIEEVLNKGGYEYIDFYQYGIPKEIMENAGFSLKSHTTNIIPNYFEPFVPENIDINYFSTDNDGLLLFKGDCDQDRPNYFRRE